jgi:hypothetical protein
MLSIAPLHADVIKKVSQKISSCFFFCSPPLPSLFLIMPLCGDHLCHHQGLPLDGRHACALCDIDLHGLCGVFYQEESIKYQNICKKCKKLEGMDKRLREKCREEQTMPHGKAQALENAPTTHRNNQPATPGDDDDETTFPSPIFHAIPFSKDCSFVTEGR